MRIVLNGKQIEINSVETILDLLKYKGLEPERVVVEYNHGIVKRDEWDKIILKENDSLEVLRFVGGG